MGAVLADDHKWIRAVGPLAILLLGVITLARAWTFGPDIQVDFGRELYLPWRVSEGDRLYADMAHFSGPLSVAWHALWFSLLGPSLWVVKVSNAIIAGGIAALVYALAVLHTDRWGATAATLFFVGALAFGQFQPIANYDYLTPYSHELVHGIALSLLGLLWFARRGVHAATVCGVIAGLVFLTKIEVFAALAGALGLGFGLRFLVDDSANAAREFARFLLAFAALIAGAWLALALHAGPASASAGLLDPWRNVLATDVASLTYYRWVMGTLDSSSSLLRLGLGALVYVAVALGIGAASAAAGRWRGGAWPWLEIAAAIAVTVTISLPSAWAVDAIRPLPLVTAGLAIGVGVGFWKARDAADPARLAVLVFALLLPLKMLLNAQFGHYGFALYMPAAMVGIAVLVGVTPRWIEARGGGAGSVRIWTLVLLLLVAQSLNARTTSQYERRTTPVGRGGDAFVSDFRAADVARALETVERMPAGATLAVLPEGIMLNYLARRVNPTPYVNFMPPEFSIYGSDAIVAAFEANPPDVVLFVHKNTGLYGAPFFGRDYGRALHGWVLAHYDAVETVGGTPFDARTRFGITLLERKTPPAR